MSEQSLNRPVLIHALQDRQGNPVTVRLNEQAARTLIHACAETFDWEITINESTIDTTITMEETDFVAFAAAVSATAKMTPTSAHFGTNRVFINHAWRAWQNAGGELDLKTFKHYLLICHAKSLLQLGSAVLMHTLNAVDLAQSETIDADDTAYHFLLLPKS